MGDADAECCAGDGDAHWVVAFACGGTYVVGVNAKPELFAPTVGAALYMVQPDPTSGVPFAIRRVRLSHSFSRTRSSRRLSAIRISGRCHTEDPYPANWTRELAFCQSVNVPFSGGLAELSDGSELQRVVDPRGAHAGSASGAGRESDDQWDEPVHDRECKHHGGKSKLVGAERTSYGYTVNVLQVIAMPNVVEFFTAGTYSTAQTSVTLPPLTAGNTYVFLIITRRMASPICRRAVSFSTADGHGSGDVGADHGQLGRGCATARRCEAVGAIPESESEFTGSG